MKHTFLLPFIICFTLSISYQAFAQKEVNVWHFGDSAGLDFNAGSPPVPLTNGAMDQIEGCASICDKNGNLLFYTNGMEVWDRTHTIMPNGTGLLGNWSSTQSAVIVPRPGSNNLYYIFTIFCFGGRGLEYAVVDMNQNGGFGDVISKNDSLVYYTTEKVTAVRHCNNVDVWVITHGWDDDAFYAFLVTAAGVYTTPVVSHVGSVHPKNPPYMTNAIGHLKASPNGSKLALGCWAGFFELFDFDNLNGTVSNPVTMPNYNGAYGVEFSPDNTKLYAVTDSTSNIYQFDLLAGSATNIVNSATVIGTSASKYVGALQIGPDGKIYVARSWSPYLGVINSPNKLGTACNYVDNGIFLAGKRSMLGLPNFIQSYFYEPDFAYNDLCFGDTTFFITTSDTSTIDSVWWDFGDPSTGTLDMSIDYNPSHMFSSPGNYTVELIMFHCGITDTATKIIQIATSPVVNLGNDTSICSGSLLLDAGTGYNSYMWQNGTTNQTLVAATTNIYWVEVTDSNGCKGRDTINVTINPNLIINLGNDTSVCEGESITLDAGVGYTSYLWQDGSANQTLVADTSGLYWVEVTDSSGCSGRDSIQITTYPNPVASLGNDTAICQGESITFDAGSGYSSYIWQDATTNQTITVSTAGTYRVEVTDNNGCKDTDTIQLAINPNPVVDLGDDTILCENQLTLNAGNNGAAYLWQDASNNQTLTITAHGNYWVQVTDTNGCVGIDSIIIAPCPSEIWIPNAFTPNGDGNNDNFKVEGINILSFEMYIYNRWGELIFELKDINKAWDGKYNGEICQDGVYAYIIIYKNLYNQIVNKNGMISLIR